MGLIDAAVPMVSLARNTFSFPVILATLLPFMDYLMFGLLMLHRFSQNIKFAAM
jgi:hypothetical protein